MKQRKHRSTDLYQDTAIQILTGETSDLIVENSMVIFERPMTDKTLKAVDEFNGGLLINVLLFSQALKRRRAEMLMRKKTGV